MAPRTRPPDGRRLVRFNVYGCSLELVSGHGVAVRLDDRASTTYILFADRKWMVFIELARGPGQAKSNLWEDGRGDDRIAVLRDFPELACYLSDTGAAAWCGDDSG